MPKKFFIIVDKDGRPMSWSVNQLCYCNDETWQDKPHVLVPYSEGRARKFIERSIKYSIENKITTLEYRLMPIKLPVKFNPYNK